MERQQQKNVCVCIKSFAAAATVAVVVVADVAASAASSNALSFIFLGAWVHGAANFQLQQFRTKGNTQHATCHMPHAACNQLQHKRKNVNANLNMFPHDVAHFERALCCLIPRHALPLSLFLSPFLCLCFLSISLSHTHSCISCNFSPAATSYFTWPNKLHKVFAAFPFPFAVLVPCPFSPCPHTLCALSALIIHTCVCLTLCLHYL